MLVDVSYSGKFHSHRNQHQQVSIGKIFKAVYIPNIICHPHLRVMGVVVPTHVSHN